MKRSLITVMIASIGFALWTASAVIWIKRPSTNSTPTPSRDCTPRYDETVVSRNLKESDDPQLLQNFQELPLYAMPDCVDEAYSLTWIPSFHEAVVVRVWRSGNEAFMVAKILDAKGWSQLGKLKETNSRPLTNFEWREITQLLNKMSYWELPSTVDEISLNDGAVWLVDGLRGKHYHWIRRRIPDEQYAEVCKHLIRLSGLETAHALYLPAQF